MAEIPALTIFRDTLKTGKLSDAQDRTLIREYGAGLKPGEGQNRNAVAAAARKLAKKPWDAPLDDIEAHKGNWAPAFGPETFSPEYSGWWAFALGILFGNRWWDAVGKVWIAANALAAIDHPNVIRLVTKRGESERRLTGDAKWPWGKAPFSQMPGPRFVWRDPLSVHTLIQRAIAHPCLGLAAGRQVTIRDWNHGNFGLPLAVLLDRKAKKPASWGTVKLDRAAVDHLDWLPKLPQTPKTWFRFQWFGDGTKIVAMSHNRGMNTRGPVLLSLSRGRQVAYYTASADRGTGGSWWSCKSRLVGNVWVIESQNRRLEVEMPGTPELEVLWDSEGARVVGEPVPNGGNGPGGGNGPDAIQKAKKWAKTLPDLADSVTGKNQQERQALGQIKNRGKQIVKLLGG